MMLIYTGNPGGVNGERILDTESGLVYEFWPETTRDEQVLHVFSVHSSSDRVYPVKYKGNAAVALWSYILGKATHLSGEYAPNSLSATADDLLDSLLSHIAAARPHISYGHVDHWVIQTLHRACDNAKSALQAMESVATGCELPL